MYYKKIDKRKIETIVDFLKNHFRYDTMNNWNCSTSYANNIKLHNIEQPKDIDDDVWYGMLEMTDWVEQLSDMLDDFGRNHKWKWQVGINGRSGGYVVLYRGGIKPSGYKSYCNNCGQKNFKAVIEGETGMCGLCNDNARENFKQTNMQVFSYPGKDVDMGEDFEEWSLSELQERAELIQDFDKLCDKIVTEFIYFCTNFRITEEEISVPKTIKVLKPIVIK